MHGMFTRSKFNKDISNWDVSNVTNMERLFMYSKFNKDISNWNVSNVTNFCATFDGAIFNKDISQWDVSNATNMTGMFDNAKFRGDISNWKINPEINIENDFFRGWKMKNKPQFKVNELSIFPIPHASNAQQEELSHLVMKILSIKKEDINVNTSELETIIDLKVAELYNL